MSDIRFVGGMFYCASCGEGKPSRLFGKFVLDCQGGSSYRCKNCMDEAQAPDLEAVERVVAEIEERRVFVRYGECEKCHNHDELTMVAVGRREKGLCAECAEKWTDQRLYRPKQMENKRPPLALEEREAYIGECARKLQGVDGG
jgi:hypothetical protein